VTAVKTLVALDLAFQTRFLNEAPFLQIDHGNIVKVFEAGETKDAFGMNQNTLNRAVAIAMCDGPEAGLTHIDALLDHGELANYYLAPSARADMYRRLGRTAEARSSYEKALALTQQEPERQFLQERIRHLK
jgi:predicted RNA polymerase sigma factor